MKLKKRNLEIDLKSEPNIVVDEKAVGHCWIRHVAPHVFRIALRNECIAGDRIVADTSTVKNPKLLQR